MSARGRRRGLLVTDIDGTLILPGADQPGLDELCAILGARDERLVFAVATGRSDAQARRVLAARRIPEPDVVIAGVGTSIAYAAGGGPGRRIDRGWDAALARRWDAGEARSIGERVPGLVLQPPDNQDRFKVSFDLDPAVFDRAALAAAVAAARAAFHVVVSRGAQLDLLPRAASKGRAVRRVRRALGIPRAWTLAAGDSGNDEDMLADAGLAVIVADHGPELAPLRGRPGTLFSAAAGAAAILDGLHRAGWRDLAPGATRRERETAGQLRSGVG